MKNTVIPTILQYLPKEDTTVADDAPTTDIMLYFSEAIQAIATTHARTTHARTHTRTHARTHTCMHACTHARMHACTHACTRTRTRTRTRNTLFGVSQLRLVLRPTLISKSG